MKTKKLIFLSIILSLIFSIFPCNIFADETIYGSYTVNSLSLTSYSPNWNDTKLKSLYTELLTNFHSDELSCLSSITIFPNSPYGVNGYYYDDISYKDGVYTLGKNAKIELYNGNKHSTIEEMSKFLSHEYGHHYTTYNIVGYEHKYYSQWYETGYAKLRMLNKYPVMYGYNELGYIHKWDVAELAANDYVQLLGSPLAKSWHSFTENQEINPALSYFNLHPQENTDIPLAANTAGLYEYFLNIGSFSGASNSLKAYPSITEIKNINEADAQISWLNAEGDSPFSYTLIMYPKGNKSVPVPIKTTKDGEENSAVLKNALNIYEGKYEFKLYTRDNLGFTYESEPFLYDFGSLKIDNEQTTETTEASTVSKSNQAIAPNNYSTMELIEVTRKPIYTVFGPAPNKSLDHAFASAIVYFKKQRGL